MYDADYYESLPVAPRKEQINALVDRVVSNVEDLWGRYNKDPNLSTQERIYGTVYTIFDILENGSRDTPPMTLTPVIDKDLSDKKCRELIIQILHPWDADDPRGKHWQNGNGQFMPYRWNRDPLSLQRGDDGSDSLTERYNKIYDIHRNRLAASARDLFVEYPKERDRS